MEPVIAKGTKERILDAALASFGSVGYDGTSLDNLAGDLGVRKQTILYHFVTKRGLLAAVVDRAAGELIGALEEVLASTARGWERVESLVRTVFRLALREPQVLGLLREVSRPGSAASGRLRNLMTPLMDRAVAWMESEMAAGRMRRTDPRLVVLAPIRQWSDWPPRSRCCGQRASNRPCDQWPCAAASYCGSSGPRWTR